MNNVEEELKELILSNYKSLREFTLKIGMPYSTLDTILKRGVDKANIINILKICNELNINADRLANGKLESKPINCNTLSNEALTLISNFDKLNDLGKNEANKRVSELTELYKYTSKTESNTDTITTFAAHTDENNPLFAKYDEKIARDFINNLKNKKNH